MSEIKTHWRKLQNPNYLGSYAFQPNQKMILTISKVQNEMVKGQDGGEESCAVCYFKEPGVKPMILNVTNSKMIAKLHGTPYIEEWGNKRIELYVAKVKSFGDTVDALRISPVVPKDKEKPAFLPASDPWNKALDKKATLETIRNHYKITPEHEQQYSAELLSR